MASKRMEQARLQARKATGLLPLSPSSQMRHLSMSQAGSELHRLCRNGDISAIRSYLRETIVSSVINNVAGQNGCSPVHEAAMAGRADVIHLLAEESESMKINVRTQCGPASTAMHLAAERGHDECIVALVACGARLDVVDRRCRTAKDVAMENGHWSVVLIIDLFELEAAVAAGDLQRAKEILSELEKHTALSADALKPFHQDKLNMILKQACMLGNYRIVMILIQAGANCFSECIDLSRRANHILAYLRLCQAAHEGDVTAIQLILERDDEKLVSHPRYDDFVEYQQILMPLLDNGRLSIATPIKVALKANHPEAARQILMKPYSQPHQGLIDWHSLGLESLLPSWLLALEGTNLQYLSLYSNRLTQVPPEIVRFNTIVKLQLSKNSIASVPDGILLLPRIESLDLSYNCITALPEAILGPLPVSLTELDLSYNKLVSLPGYFKNSNVTLLNLCHNRLKSVPKCVCSLRQLDILNISENVCIRHVPYELGGLRNLRILAVTGLPYAVNIPVDVSTVLTFLQARFRSMQTVTHFQLVVIGFPNNRQTLQRVLEIISVAGLHCSILRFDSPSQFLYLHDVFELPNTVYVTVWDCESGQDVNDLNRLLRHIALYAPDSPSIVAACWRSLVDFHSELSVENAIARSVWRDLSSQITLVKFGLELQGANEHDNVPDHFIKVVEGAGNRVNFMQFVPGSYYSSIDYLKKVSQEMRSRVHPPMLEEWDFWELVRSIPTHDLSSHRELPELVAFLVSVAAIIHIPCPHKGAQDLYILDRQWFCDVLGRAVARQRGTMAFSNPTAIVLQESLVDLLACPSLFHEPLPVAFSMFVCEHGIALALNSEKWLVPAMLHAMVNTTVTDLSSQYGNRRQYTFALTPASFWGRLITHLLINMDRLVHIVSGGNPLDPDGPLVSNSSVSHSSSTDWSYWSAGIICWHNAIDLLYSIEAISTQDEPYVEGFEIRTPLTSVGSRTMQVLCYTIDSLLCNWYPATWSSVELWVPCSYCIQSGASSIPSIPFQDCLLAVAKGVGLKCMQHPDNIVLIESITPDLIQEDITGDYCIPPWSVSVDTSDKSTCLSAPPSETVFKGKCTQQAVAVKLFPSPVPNPSREVRPWDGRTPAQLRAWIEFETLRHTLPSRCPFLLDMIGLCPDPLSLVLPLAQWGSLEEVMQAKELSISYQLRVRMMYQLATALQALHSQSIIHRNVCLANILVYSLSCDDMVNIRLGGLSEACHGFFQGLGRGCHGTFLPPEVCRKGLFEYDERVDIFAFGFVAYEIITHSRLYLQSQFPLQELSASKMGRERPSLLPIEDRLPYMVPIIDRCWNANFCKRPFAADVVDHLQSPLHLMTRGALVINEQHEYFASAANFSRVKNTFHANIFLCSGLLSGDGTTCLSHLSLPGLEYNTCTSLPSDFVICMCCVGFQLWVSFYGKMVRVYSTSTLEFISEFTFTHHVVAMAVSPTAVYLGLENGVMQIYDVVDNSVPTEPSLSYSVCNQEFKCIEAMEDYVVCATKNVIFKLHPDRLHVKTRWNISSGELEIRSVVMTQCNEEVDTVWICYRRLDRVDVRKAVDGVPVCSFECSHAIKRSQTKTWVITMRVVVDTVWVGLNSGHLLIFSASSLEPRLLIHLQVHKEALRQLLLLHPAYMGPTSIPFAGEDVPDVETVKACLHPKLPDSVMVLSCGQGIQEPLPVLADGVIAPACVHDNTQCMEGLCVVQLEGMSASRLENLERNALRETAGGKGWDESYYDMPPETSLSCSIVKSLDLSTDPSHRLPVVARKRRNLLTQESEDVDSTGGNDKFDDLASGSYDEILDTPSHESGKIPSIHLPPSLPPRDIIQRPHMPAQLHDRHTTSPRSRSRERDPLTYLPPSIFHGRSQTTVARDVPKYALKVTSYDDLSCKGKQPPNIPDSHNSGSYIKMSDQPLPDDSDEELFIDVLGTQQRRSGMHRHSESEVRTTTSASPSTQVCELDDSELLDTLHERAINQYVELNLGVHKSTAVNSSCDDAVGYVTVVKALRSE